MSKSQRTKGHNGERELARTLSGMLDIDVKRQLQQTREGGYDLDGLPFALEVKRQEKLLLNNWWDQALSQAKKAGKPPALAYRQNRKKWRFVVYSGELGIESDYTVEVGIELFCLLVSKKSASCRQK